MSYSIPTLLTRNLHDVFGEKNPALRRAAINEMFTEDCVFYDPKGGASVRGAKARHLGQQAIKRLGEPKVGDRGGSILTSDDAAFINGEAIVVDGGQYRIG